MPVAPAIPLYNNLHRDLPETQLHEPKGFTDAAYDSFITKSIHGENVWQSMLFQQPVLGFVNLGTSVSPSNGDRYIVLGTTSMGSSAEFGGATPNAIVEYLTLDASGTAYNSWDFVAPLLGMIALDADSGQFYTYNGSSWVVLGTGGTTPTVDTETITFVGSNVNTYIDLYTPTAGIEIDTVTYVVDSLLPSLDSVFVTMVLRSGTTNITVVDAVSTAELNSVKKSKFDIDAIEVPAGYSLKLFVSGANITSGTIKVITNYLP